MRVTRSWNRVIGVAAGQRGRFVGVNDENRLVDDDEDLERLRAAQLLELAQRRRRVDGYLLVASMSPLLGQQAVRAWRDRNVWGVLAAVVTGAAAVARAELMVRQIPAQHRAGAEQVRHRRAVIADALARGQDPYAAANDDARRHGLNMLPTVAAVVVFIAGQAHRRRRGPDPEHPSVLGPDEPRVAT